MVEVLFQVGKSRQRLFCSISYQGGCCNPHGFSMIGVLCCFIRYLCVGLGPFYPYQPEKEPKIFMWRHYDVIYYKTVKKKKKKRKKKKKTKTKKQNVEWQNLFVTVKCLGTFEFHQVGGKSFFFFFFPEWIGKYKKISLGSTKQNKEKPLIKEKKITWVAPSPYTLFEWLSYPRLGTPGIFFAVMSGRDGWSHHEIMTLKIKLKI